MHWHFLHQQKETVAVAFDIARLLVLEWSSPLLLTRQWPWSVCQASLTADPGTKYPQELDPICRKSPLCAALFSKVPPARHVRKG